jgi:hypothetical protein
MPRSLRPCAGCDVIDDGPRHVIGLADATEGTPPPPDWHPQCHAAAGCTTCTEQIRSMSDG